MEIGLSLGSNLGDRLAQLREARRSIRALDGVRLLAASPVYETEPVDVASRYQSLPFLNAVLIVSVSGEIGPFAQQLAAIESALGRQRGAERNAPRTIDIDVIYADDLQMESPGLMLPHPRWAQRRFVAQPLADVRSELVLPGDARRVRDVLAGLQGQTLSLFAAEW